MLTAKEARERWWRELALKGDPLHQTDLWKAFEAGFGAGVDGERERCGDIVTAARFDEVDRDWRAIGSMIDNGQTAEEIKARS